MRLGGRSGWAAALAAIALLTAGAATAPAHALHVGVIDDTQDASDVGADQDLIAQTGAHWIREDLAWADVEPSAGHWDWSRYDALFAAAAQRHLHVLPIMDAPPCWAVPAGTDPGKCRQTYPTDDAQFAAYVAAAIERYGPAGTFWRANPGLDATEAAITWVEVWNEPYFTYYSNNDVSPERYARLYATTVAAGRAANPRTRWLAEAYGTVQDADPQYPGPVTWAQGMVRGVPGIAADIDALAIHVYPGAEPPQYDGPDQTDLSVGELERTHADFEALGIERPVWVTEGGYSACERPVWCVPGPDQATREQVKADWLGQLLDTLGADDLAYVHAFFDFRLRQWTDPSQPDDDFGGWQGLMNGYDGSHLPAYAPFVAAVGRYDGTPTPDTTIASAVASADTASVTFSSDDVSAGFACRVDAQPFAPCRSPATFSGLAPGDHEVDVQAVGDEAVDPTPASATVTIASPPLASPAPTPPPATAAPSTRPSTPRPRLFVGPGGVLLRAPASRLACAATRRVRAGVRWPALGHVVAVEIRLLAPGRHARWSAPRLLRPRRAWQEVTLAAPRCGVYRLRFVFRLRHWSRGRLRLVTKRRTFAIDLTR